MGNLLQVFVHAANIHDTIAGTCIFDLVKEKYPSVKAFSADAGYRGTSVDYVEKQLGLKLDISTKIIDGFAVLPERWVVERTLAWTTYSRRLSKDFEINPVHSEKYGTNFATQIVCVSLHRKIMKTASKNQNQAPDSS